MINSIIKLDVSKEDLMNALKKALNEEFIDNLRSRGDFVKLDSKIRGYIGEITLKKWFSEKGILFEKTNYFDDQQNMDMDFIFNNGEEIIIELKTSLIPDIWRDIEITIKKADIKLIKRTQEIEQLHGDFHIQIYFNKKTKERDNYLNSLDSDIISNKDFDEIFNIMKLIEYEVLFVSWIDKKSIIDYIHGLIEKGLSPTWRFGFRDFWKCPISEIGKKPELIINELKVYKK